MVSYNFESLNQGYLIGQDGWVPDGNNATNLLVSILAGDYDTTKFVTRSSSTGGADAWRRKNSAFNFLTPTGQETNYMIQFDVRAIGLTGAIGLGSSADVSLGPVFGYGYTDSQGNSGKLYIRKSSYGAATTSASLIVPGSWYRLRLHMNFLANSGQGAGTLEVMNLTAGQTNFVLEPKLQNINLDLPSAPPTSWDQIHIRLDGNCEMDNFYVTAEPPAVRLTLHTTPQGLIVVAWLSETNFAYQLQSSKYLESWTPGTTLRGTGRSMGVIENGGPDPNAKFYRLLIAP